MDKYRKIMKPKETIVKNEEEIRVTAAGSVSAYVSRAAKLFNEMEKPHIVIAATGNALTKAVTSAEVIKRRFKGLHQVTKLGSQEIVDEYEPLEEGLDKVSETRNLPFIEIKLSKEALDTSDKGYQAPIDESEVKEYDPEEMVSRGRGRGGGRGRGKGRGKGKSKDKGDSPAKGKGKGKGKGKEESAGKGKGKGKRSGSDWSDWEEPSKGKGKGKSKGKGKGDWDDDWGKGKSKGKGKGEPKGKGKGKSGNWWGESEYDYNPPSRSKGKAKGGDKGKGKGKWDDNWYSGGGYDQYDNYGSYKGNDKGYGKGKDKGYGKGKDKGKRNWY